MSYNNAYIFHIEHMLKDIERIFNNYIPYPKDAIYYPLYRLPILSRASAPNANILSTTPSLSYLCIEFFKETILNTIYNISENPSLYVTNSVTHNGNIVITKFIDRVGIPTKDILISYIPSIHHLHAQEILGLYNLIEKQILNVIPNGHDKVFDINTDKEEIVIIERCSIYKHRYEEAKLNISLNKGW